MQFSRTAKLCAALAPLSILATQTTFAVDDVNGGPLFTLTNSATAPNGVWSWFEDERAIIDNSDPLNPLLILSSVSAGGAPENGDIDLLWRNLGSGAQGEFELHNQLQQDDHDSAALYIRTDGRYLAMYSEHGSDPFTRWRVSVNPHDPTAWGPEQTLNNGAGTTYNNTYYLPGDNDGLGLLYNFTRTVNYDPNVQVSSDQGSTWSNAGKLLTEGGGGDRPYVRYASDGEKIHFIATDRHPRNFANSIYHGYVQDGVLYNSDGSVIDADLFDAAGVAPNKLTQVFANGSQFSGTTMNRAWTINMEVDNTGNPVAIFSARVNDDDDDHRFFYARYDGADWRVHEMAEAGGFLYAAENDYTGLASIDPNNPNVVYMSSEIDPITGVATGSGKYELYKGVTDDFGASWAWSAITEDSTVDNLRPVVPAWDGENTAVTWLRGTYSSYTNWSTEVVGISFAADDARSQRWNGAGGATWDAGATASWDSGGGATGVYSDGDEVAFDDSAASYTVNITSPVSPMGVAFNNSSNAYTMTGAGINGAGGLRVIGGGTVTLDNGLNTYTGQTLIAKGTLALTGGATLAGTPHIDVRAGGGLDVTSSNGGVYTLAGQVLTIAGQVNGGLNATAGSTVHINATNAINGELTAIASAVDGSGSINGNLIVQAAAVISVGAEGITPDPVQGVVTYVDANVTTNTTLADGSPMQEGADYVVRVPGEFGLANDMWELRTVFANDGQALGGNGGGPEDAPRLQTTISGLNAGETYEITTYFWGASGGDWRGRASLSDAAGDLPGYNTDHFGGSDFDPMSFVTKNVGAGTLNPGPLSTADASGFENGGYFINRVLTEEDNRALYEVKLGQAIADADGEVVVYIDDLANTSQDNRTWYDGVGYSSIGLQQLQAKIVSMTISGDATFGPESTLALDAYATNVLEKLEVGGNLHAGGTLALHLTEGAPPLQAGDRFDVLDFSTSTGAFDTLDLPALDAGLFWDTTQLYSNGELSISDSLPVIGDTDGDGDIDDFDLLNAISNFTGSLTAGTGGKGVPEGDTDTDADVDDFDLLNMISGFTGSLPAESVNVPEPSALAVITLGGLATLRRR